MKKKMKWNNQNKSKLSVAIGIIAAWIVLIIFALVKQMETKMIALFCVMFITTGIVPVISMLKNKGEQRKCSGL
ncbi:hypothetical protein [Gilvibacter sediminis]|uniref:hypothetical protein n=1 Tax=Gilvibacter sediminis TaxID=379071 RepID=UPI0023508CC6|nr:hypothetical protein [Gilvibacter sediminis]MDC7996517.1 hypothetical protein [Gilvibacter sediminis]